MDEKDWSLPEGKTKRVDTSMGFDASPWEMIVIRVTVLLISFVTRALDVLLLLFRPRLLGPYLRVWLAEFLRSPYRLAASFEVVRVLKASGQDMRELVYGETPVATAVWIFHRAGLRRGGRLVDVVAGRGRALLGARWLGAEARGVDLLERHVASVSGAMRKAGISLQVGDATQQDLGDATHVYLAWTCLSPDTKARVIERLRTCAPGTRILTVTRPLEAPGFITVSRHWVLFTWGFERVWIHEYRPG
ncbi:class I SAM-dependent methyltransferase [Archangium violaceum]|uniref:class I SAM-dependent methyltransferase n=1 Tax=Archangium violaceum TaxID=83451 RepID=UPI0037BE63B5